jgi:E3 ubiquitin-protein ligase UBR1
MVAQIRSGLWVRNGFAIRGQLLHYRDFMLRELCFDQDIFLVQVAFAVLDPELVFASLLDRFQLLKWFSGVDTAEPYDEGQAYQMVEEFLYIVIACANEISNASSFTLQDTIRREIVHALATGPCVFTELLKRVPERLVDDASFEKILSQVSTFKPAETTTDTGVYELRDDLYHEVDPFFLHYSRNKREEVEEILRRRIKKTTGAEDPPIVPRKLGSLRGPFVNLHKMLLCKSFIHICFYSVANVVRHTDAAGSVPASADAILDQALFLVMLSLIEQPIAFAAQAAQLSCWSDGTVLNLMTKLEQHERLKAYKSRATWIIGEICKNNVEAAEQLNRTIDNGLGTGGKNDESKKRAAKARQAAIMKGFAAAQQTFLSNLDDDEMDEDDTPESKNASSFGTCMYCQEELNESRSFGSLAFIQASRFMRQMPPSVDALSKMLKVSPVLHAAEGHSHLGDSSFPVAAIADRTTFGMHASVCGHMMHFECFGDYSASIRTRHRNQAQRNHPESMPRKEFTCPLCKSLGNAMLPVCMTGDAASSEQTFVEWVRGSGIELLRSSPNRDLEQLQYPGSGGFAFWAAQDTGFSSGSSRYGPDGNELDDQHKMVDTVLSQARNLSLQTRHLRSRIEPESGDRGAGAYLPEDLVAYTLACVEIAQRGNGQPGQSVISLISDSTNMMLRGLLSCLSSLAMATFGERQELGREAIRQAILKRLLPEWKREQPYQQPLLHREPLTILIEVAAVAPEILNHALTLLYYANLTRVTIGVVMLLSKSIMVGSGGYNALPSVPAVTHEWLCDMKQFVASVCRHSMHLDRSAQGVIQCVGMERIERLILAFTLPFLRRAAILVNALSPIRKPIDTDASEYLQLLYLLNIPPPSNIAKMDSLQNFLSGWCSHYGMMHNVVSHEGAITLEYPSIYYLAPLPIILDSLFTPDNPGLVCSRCGTQPTDAGICLLCGTTVCIQSHCCREMDYQERGECNMHTRGCVSSV